MRPFRNPLDEREVQVLADADGRANENLPLIDALEAEDARDKSR